jgi:hypothetical protein
MIICEEISPKLPADNYIDMGDFENELKQVNNHISTHYLYILQLCERTFLLRLFYLILSLSLLSFLSRSRGIISSIGYQICLAPPTALQIIGELRVCHDLGPNDMIMLGY